MSKFNLLLSEIVSAGKVSPTIPPLTTLEEKELVNNIVATYLEGLYKQADEQEALGNFKVSQEDKKLINKMIETELSKEKVSLNKKTIDSLIKDFEWTVLNSGKIKDLLMLARSFK